MKLFKLIVLLFISINVSTISSSQKVDNKKGITYIDDVPYFKVNGGSLTSFDSPSQIMNYNTNKLLFVITKHSTYKISQGWYNELKFADFDVYFKSLYDYKPLIKSMYQNGVFSTSAEINEEALIKYTKLFSENW